MNPIEYDTFKTSQTWKIGYQKDYLTTPMQGLLDYLKPWTDTFFGYVNGIFGTSFGSTLFRLDASIMPIAKPMGDISASDRGTTIDVSVEE